MEHKIINTGDYLLIVDDLEIKKETYCYDSINNILVFYKGSMKNIGFQKVISHLPLNNSPILEGVDLLPPLEDEVEKLAEEYADYKPKNSQELRDVNLIKIGYKAGYNKAKEKYKYTEEDLKDIWKYVKNNRVTYEEYLQSLQQPKMPVGFKCEMVQKKPKHTDYGVLISFDNEPFTVVNTQGLTQWVGEYIY